MLEEEEEDDEEDVDENGYEDEDEEEEEDEDASDLAVDKDKNGEGGEKTAANIGRSEAGKSHDRKTGGENGAGGGSGKVDVDVIEKSVKVGERIRGLYFPEQHP